MNLSYFIALFLTVLTALFSGCSGGGGSTSPSDTVEKAPQATGSVPLLLIRLQYNDITFTNHEASWSNKIFADRLYALNHYYYEASHGVFSFTRVNENEAIQNDGVVTITLNKSHPDSGYSDIIHTDLSDAVRAASDYLDFSVYDLNQNGKVALNELQVMFIVAGYENAYDPTSTPAVWAHSNCIDTPPTVDGVTVMGCNEGGSYSLFGERHGDHDATSGIIAHELGHAAFLLPDLYDTLDANSLGIGYFGLMGYGSWGATAADEASDLYGNTPTHFCAWSKIDNGWITPLSLDGITDHDVNLTETASSSYNIIKLPIDSSEYFLLENRNNRGYDEGLYGLDGVFDGGLAIWHIDESVMNAKRASNEVNTDESHRAVDIEEANTPDPDYSIDNGGKGDEQNLYYLGNKVEFSPSTSPNSNDYSGAVSGIIINNISERGATMSATVTN
ncbi:MAG: M6 family metalloprotease domain-containing protein [Campylobacterota bacterium]|nr:M6 family metalloprotease domain-containing protein [Campylobacterota bacterium]